MYIYIYFYVSVCEWETLKFLVLLFEPFKWQLSFSKISWVTVWTFDLLHWPAAIRTNIVWYSENPHVQVFVSSEFQLSFKITTVTLFFFNILSEACQPVAQRSWYWFLQTRPLSDPQFCLWPEAESLIKVQVNVWLQLCVCVFTLDWTQVRITGFILAKYPDSWSSLTESFLLLLCLVKLWLYRNQEEIKMNEVNK